jgi:hypothetical protein
MKMFIIGLLISLSALAQQVEVPKYMVDSTITVKLKNGKEYTFSGNEWMVVRRKPKAPPSSLLIIAEQQEENNKTVVKEQKLNRIKLLAGIGPTGMTSTSSNNYVEISTRNGAVGGIGYDRLINSDVSVSGQALSNGTLLLGVGKDF